MAEEQQEQNGIPSISMANTKKEMLQAYHQLKEKLEQQAQRELKPEKEQTAKKQRAAVESAEETAKSDVNDRIMGLKDEIETLSRQMDTAYGKVQEIAVKAVSGKGQEGYQAAARHYAEDMKKHSDQG